MNIILMGFWSARKMLRESKGALDDGIMFIF